MAAALAQDLADPGIEQAQVIMNFRDSANGAPRGGHRLAAGDRDSRRNALDPLGVRLFQRLKELASVGGEGLDVTPLAFRVERVKRERALPRAADPGHDDQFAQRQIQVNALEVMGLDLPKPDHGRGWGCRFRPRSRTTGQGSGCTVPALTSSERRRISLNQAESNGSALVCSCAASSASTNSKRAASGKASAT